MSKDSVDVAGRRLPAIESGEFVVFFAGEFGVEFGGPVKLLGLGVLGHSEESVAESVGHAIDVAPSTCVERLI